MIDQEWKQSEAVRLGFTDEQMDTVLCVAGRAWAVAAHTTYDEIAEHLLVRPPNNRPYELERMAVLLGDDIPDVATLEMATQDCQRPARWHVYHDDGPGAFFCNQHNMNRNAAKYGGVELCQGQATIISEPVPMKQTGGKRNDAGT